MPDTAAVERDLWETFRTAHNAWKDAGVAWDQARDTKQAAQDAIYARIGSATRVTVDGQVVGERITADRKVREHTRHVDYLRPAGEPDSA